MLAAVGMLKNKYIQLFASSWEEVGEEMGSCLFQGHYHAVKRSETQSASSRIWIRVIEFISYDDNRYGMGVS